MPHYYPVVIPGGKSLAGDSLGFHAYSLRIDNLTNQWLLEETSLAWIPPYSLGVCLRLYGTGVGIILNQAPVGQPQLTPVTGEQAVGVYSSELRTEVAGSPVRQYSLVQSVSDLTQGPIPAFPPVGIDRLWADTSGNIHHVHSNGQDLTLVDPSQIGVVTSQMILDGTIQNVDLAAGVAAANIGTVNGVLTGTLPNPGMAAGAAATNIGTLGGVLSGTLPNPGLVVGSATAQTYQLAGSGATTASASITVLPGFSLSMTTKGGLVFARFSFNVSVSVSGGMITFYLRMDGGSWGFGLAAGHSPVANFLYVLTGMQVFGPAAGAHTWDVGWSVNTGTATVSNGVVSSFSLEEFRA